MLLIQNKRQRKQKRKGIVFHPSFFFPLPFQKEKENEYKYGFKDVYKSYLRKQESKSVKKIIHTGWGNAILKYFDVKESKKYSKEQCRIIQSLVEEVEASRRPVDEREE